MDKKVIIGKKLFITLLKTFKSVIMDMDRIIKFEFGFEKGTRIEKISYELHEIPSIRNKCDLWHVYPLLYARQYTGLKDRNGKEIYEGDVLELPNGTKGIVEWLECGFVLRLKSETIWQNLLFNVINHYKIIGNIYENPELAIH